MTDISKLKKLPVQAFADATPADRHFLNQLTKLPDAIEEIGTGKESLGGSAVNKQTGTSYTFDLPDAGKIVEFENSSAITVTIPPWSEIPFKYQSKDSEAARIDVVATGSGTVTFQGGSGVTLRSKGSATDLADQWAAATLYQRDKDEWVLAGDIA